MSNRAKTERARAELMRLRGKEPPKCGEPMRTWYAKYTALVVELMLTLPDERLADWRNLFTALYELAGMGFHHFARPGVTTEDEAWSRVDPWEHMLFSYLYSRLPKGVDARSFAVEYMMFIVYLGRERIVAREVCQALYERYSGLLRMAA
jgi:hypothetical protein